MNSFTTVKIFAKDIEIIYSDTLTGSYQVLAETDYYLSQIRVDSNQSTQNKLDSIVHEILHHGLSMVKKNLDNEENVEALTLLLTTVMKDNKELFKKIIEEL